MDLIPEILSIYMDILKISSPPGKEKNLRRKIQELLIQEGLPEKSITEDPYGNLIIDISPHLHGHEEPETNKHTLNNFYEVIFTAHLDNYIKKHTEMSPYYMNGRILNKSSPVLGGDDKTAVAAFLAFGMYMFRRSRSNNIRFHPFRIIFTSHEENLTWKGWSYGARRLKSDYIKNADLIIAMDVPSGKKIRHDHFFIYHCRDSSDPVIEAAVQAAAKTGIGNIYYESESEGFIGGDATTFYRKHRKKVLDFATGNFYEHTASEFTDLRIYLKQILWIFNLFYYLQKLDNSDLIKQFEILKKEDTDLDIYFSDIFSLARFSPAKNSPSQPAPVKDPVPTPVKPSPGKPSPEKPPSPGRPAPVPGREPRPVTDPKNIYKNFIKEYYHTAPENLKELFSGVTPYNRNLFLSAASGNSVHDTGAAEDHSSGYPDILISEMWSDYMNILERLGSHSLVHKYGEHDLPSLMKRIQSGREREIMILIEQYMSEILGENYQSVKDYLDVAWFHPYENTHKTAPQFVKQWFRESGKPEEVRNQGNEKDDSINLDYLKEVLIRTEINLLLIQGFSVLYMDGFFRMFRKELNRLNPELAEIYELFHLYGRLNHFSTFEDVLSGRRLPPGTDSFMENHKSQGRVWFSSDPVTDENTGEILSMNNRAHARSEFGVVLVHEALKGAIQLLLPWARFHETYLNDEERKILRQLTGTFFAEIRQFATGPAFFRLFQKYCDSLSVPSKVSDSAFFKFADSLSEMKADELLKMTSAFSTHAPSSEII